MIRPPALADFQSNYQRSIETDIEKGMLDREALLTESIAVGCESFVRRMEKETTNRSELEVNESGPNQWTLRERPASYG